MTGIEQTSRKELGFLSPQSVIIADLIGMDDCGTWFAGYKANPGTGMKPNELHEYQMVADALIRLNRAASTLLKHGANPEAIKMILTGTAQLFSELEDRMSRSLSPEDQKSVQLHFPTDSEAGFHIGDSGAESEA